MLRMRTGFSFRAAIGLLPEYAALVQGPDAPITDRASTYGWVGWDKICKTKGWTPRFGIELAVSPDVNAKRPIADNWIFFPIGKSLGPLTALAQTATAQFRYQPLLTYEQTAKAKGVSKIAGHRCLLQHIPKNAKNLYLGLSPALSQGLYRAAQKAGIPLALTGENVYPRPKDLARYQLICERNASTQTWAQHFCNIDELEDAIPYKEALQDAKLASLAILSKATAQIPKAQLPEPERQGTLEEMCQQSAPSLGIDLNDPIYAGRLKHELDIISAKNFEDYFHIVSEVCRWAKSQGIMVGPARGSAAGSLLCYLLDITSVDPIPHGLLFERFINYDRNDLPDIDVDFSDSRREEVISHLRKVYGADRVSRLGTVMVFRARTSLKRTAQAHNIPLNVLGPIYESMIERSGGDARANDTIIDTLNERDAGQQALKKYPYLAMAGELEGHPMYSSQHASAVVLNRKPLSQLAPLDLHTGSLLMNKKDAEEIDLLKIDVLGLTQLSVFERAMQHVGKPVSNLFDIPLDDAPALQTLKDRRYCGIFQFNGSALQSLTDNLLIGDTVRSFDDLAALSALARPGPLASGSANRWLEVRSGKSPDYIHPLFKPFTESTNGVVIYQEQIMEIGQKIGGLDVPQVSALRRAMSKSYGREFFDQYGDPWKKEAIHKGIPPEIAERFWDEMCDYGSWSFNKSHAVSYGLISYWCCWLKAHHPLPFYAATLDYEDDEKSALEVLREAKAIGIDYKAVDDKKSGLQWTYSGNVLLGPLTNVVGIGEKTAKSIMRHRDQGLPITAGQYKKLTKGRRKFASLYPVRDALRKACPDLTKRNIVTKRINTLDVINAGMNDTVIAGPVIILGIIKRFSLRDANELINISRRGGVEITDGPTTYLNLWIEDDTGQLFTSISRWKYQRMGRQIVEKGKIGRTLYAFKGEPTNYNGLPMLRLETYRILGESDGDI